MIRRAGEELLAHPWWMAAGLAALVSLIPAVDLWFSGLFFTPQPQSWVPRSNVMQFARSGIPPLIIGGLVTVVLLWIAGRITGTALWTITGRKISYLVISLALGPGLIVESLLKTQSGRARPRDVINFGGSADFTPPLWLADACERNCSFVSGHAAVAFWTTAFAFLLPPAHRSIVIAAGVFLGAAMGLARMMEGAHFLSDVVFAGLIVVGFNMWLAGRMGLADAVSGKADGA
jgi:lipid A 4'-phosphatase